MSVGPAIGDRETLSLDAAEFAKLATELVNERIRGRGVVENADMRPSLHASAAAPSPRAATPPPCSHAAGSLDHLVGGE